jgi:hypothetical protein
MYDEYLFEEYTINTANPLLFITNLSCLSNITTEYFTGYCDTVLSNYKHEKYTWVIICNGVIENALQTVKSLLYIASWMSSKLLNTFEKLHFQSPPQCIHNALFEEWSKLPCHIQNLIVMSN